MRPYWNNYCMVRTFFISLVKAPRLRKPNPCNECRASFLKSFEIFTIIKGKASVIGMKGLPGSGDPEGHS
jgi:hypothetical protein